MIENLIRQVTLLFFIAILVYWFIKSIIEKKIEWKRTIVAIVLTIIVFNTPLQIFSMIGTQRGMLKEPVGKHAAPTLSTNIAKLGFQK
jgi:apolipoprotein N-acyltransferase